jgi:hypothetical protein
MKSASLKVTALVAVLLLNAIPAISDEDTYSNVMNNTSVKKDECLLVAMNNCPNYQDSYQERIDKIQTEINKGTTVYTEDELNVLKKRLDDANNDLWQIEQRN